MKHPSLRINLIRALVLPLAAAMLFIGVFSVLSIYHEVDEVYDATLVQFAKTLSRSAENFSLKHETHHLAHKYERNISYRIFKGGQMIAQSNDNDAFGDIVPVAGFSDQVVNGKAWRFFTFIDEDAGYTIEVAEKYGIRRELTLHLLSSLIFPGIVFVIAAFAVIWWGVTQGLQRLVGLSAEMDRREADDLTPVSDPAVPAEIQPLLDALNRLFLRISQSFSREREFTDNAAHELRTPLAAMKTQAQVILKTEKLTPEGQAGFDNLLASIDRAVDMTESLLSLARVQADTNQKQPIDLGEVAKRECAGFEKAANAKKISLSANFEENTFVSGVPYALGLLARNIIQNAIKFTPPGGSVAVTVEKVADEIVFSVTDTGPGIPDAYKDKVFDRFFRVNKSSQTGSGLGLAMVKWIADAHHARIHLADNKPAGTVITVAFKVTTPFCPSTALR